MKVVTLFSDLVQNSMTMKYRVVLHQSEEGYSVSCPGLPGCWSQGATEEEALENIRSAIGEYLAVLRRPQKTRTQNANAE